METAAAFAALFARELSAAGKVAPGVVQPGVMSPVAATGEHRFSGSGGAATAAHLRYPRGLEADAAIDLDIVHTVSRRFPGVSPDWRMNA